MAYTTSQAFAGRGSSLGYSVNLSLGYNTIDELTQMDFSGTKLDLADVTNYESGIFKEWLPTLLDSGELAFKGNFIASDASQATLLGYFNAATKVNWYLTLPTNPATGLPYGHFTFVGYVTEYTWGIPLAKQAEITGKIKITGAIAYVSGS